MYQMTPLKSCIVFSSLSVTNIGLGTNIFGSQFSQFGDDTIFWVYIGYLIFFLVLTVGLFILFTVLALTGDSEGV